MTLADILTPTPAGLYCPPGDFHIDPTRATPRALITHGHADHARRGHAAVLATRETLDLMALRYGARFTRQRQEARPGESVRIGDVDVRFIPAGHVLGSAQVVIEWRGYRAIVSGDYKRAHDRTCAPFEPMRCDGFVTEATFGLPVFRGMDAGAEAARLLKSLSVFPDRAHLVGVYSLGKAQRLMGLLREAGWERQIIVHPALLPITRYYAEQGAPIGAFAVADDNSGDGAGDVVLCPPNALTDSFAARFAAPVTAFASGWTRVRRLAGGVHLPLAISDHADWDDLCATIIDTGCADLWITHGAEAALTHWARGRGIDARPLRLAGYDVEGEGANE